MKFSLFHAAPDTGNLGVTALCYATLFNFTKQKPDSEFTVFDHGRGTRIQKIQLDNLHIKYKAQGAIYSRRFYRPENIRLWKFLGYLGGLGNPGIKIIQESDAVLDITGGDSFTDLYGIKRFKSMIIPKMLSFQQKKTLILLPQTYGPYKSQRSWDTASSIVKKARVAFARDERSFQVLKELLGTSFDTNLHKSGVDMAFGLPVVKPIHLDSALEILLEDKKTEKIGINVSGLLYNNPTGAKEKFGFKADYNRSIEELIRRFVKETVSRIVLIPHVVTPEGHYESDINACQKILKKLGNIPDDRIIIAPSYNNPCEIKWIISRLNWFCGTRMHATIAALSTGVPASAISYSPKTLGVFETCGQGDHVADPQKLDDIELVESIWQSWLGRENASMKYEKYLPVVMQTVEEQTRFILDKIC